jgi:hypothetical protein
MNRPSTRNDPHTHYSLQSAASDDGFFKLNSLKSSNDSDIEVYLAKWDLGNIPLTKQILWKQPKFIWKADREMVIQWGRAPRAQTLPPTPTTTTVNIEYLRTLPFWAKHADLGYDESDSWVASNKIAHMNMNRLPTQNRQRWQRRPPLQVQTNSEQNLRENHSFQNTLTS